MKTFDPYIATLNTCRNHLRRRLDSSEFWGAVDDTYMADLTQYVAVQEERRRVLSLPITPDVS